MPSRTVRPSPSVVVRVQRPFVLAKVRRRLGYATVVVAPCGPVVDVGRAMLP